MYHQFQSLASARLNGEVVIAMIVSFVKKSLPLSKSCLFQNQVTAMVPFDEVFDLPMTFLKQGILFHTILTSIININSAPPRYSENIFKENSLPDRRF